MTLSLRALTPADAPGLVALARAAFNAPWTEAFIDWKYFQNPAGGAVGACAESEGRVVASFSHTPVRMQIGGVTAIGMQAVDAMVLPEFRRQKLFAQLAQQTYARLDAASAPLAYVFPAAAVRTPFVGQFAYAEVGSVPRFVKVLRGSQLGQSLGRPGPKAWLDQLAWAGGRARHAAWRPVTAQTGLHIEAASQFDERFDQLWRSASRQWSISAVRDSAYLSWRYRHNPLHDYLILTVTRAERLLGYAVLSLDPQRLAAYLVELVVDEAEAAAGYWLLAEAASRAQQAGCVQLQCWMLPQHDFYIHLLQRSGFVYWPSRLLPGWLRYSTSFIVRVPAGHQVQPSPTALDNWFLSMGDHDYY